MSVFGGAWEWLTGLTWAQAIKGLLGSVPVAAHVVWRWMKGKEVKERADAQNEADDVAADTGPGSASRAGHGLRDLMRDTK